MAIIVFIIVLLVGVGLGAVVQVWANKRKLAEMDRLIAHFEEQEFADEQGKEVAKTLLRKRLIKIKSRILADQNAIAQAADKIAYL